MKNISMDIKNVNRIPWIDISRGIAFLMVIYSHLQFCDQAIMKFFSPVFLTTFFFVSGYLFKSGCSFFYVLEQRTRTLLIPFLIFGFIMICMQHVLTMKDNVVSWQDGFAGLVLQNGDNQILWFIAGLYVYSLAFYWIERFFNSWLFIASLFLFVINWLVFQFFPEHNIPWHIDKLGFGCAYMGLGKVYRQYADSFSLKINGYLLLSGIILYILSIIFFDQSYSFTGSHYLIDALFITLLGLVIIIEISKRAPWVNSKFLMFVGANTLFYFAFHGKVYSVLQTGVNKLFALGYLDHSVFIDDIIGFVIVFVDAIVLIPFSMFINRFLPWTLGKGFKLWSM